MYRIAEVFYSLQGEGVRAGTANVFLRFAGCNLRCTKSDAGFLCDTDHAVTAELERPDQVVEAARWADVSRCGCVILTGGEPLLQVDLPLLVALADAGYHHVGLETNGTVAIPAEMRPWFGWVSCSPKRHAAIALESANEVRIVLGMGDVPPKQSTLPKANHYILSPASKGSALDQAAVDWCLSYAMKHPEWRVSMQLHKVWRIP